MAIATDRTLAARIERKLALADAETIETGRRWYDEGHGQVIANAFTSGRSIRHAAAELSHLSPRATWASNVAAARMFAATGERMTGVMSGPFGRAVRASKAADPMSTFGPTAHKTRAFASNLAGDLSAVTVDVWIARSVGVTEQELSRVGVYQRIEKAFQRVASRHGLEPAQLQAIVWIVQRGSAV